MSQETEYKALYERAMAAMFDMMVRIEKLESKIAATQPNNDTDEWQGLP